jgi:RimJ/RimL family protein N-acetyltransferase
MSEVDGEITFELCRPIEEHAKQVMVWRNDPSTLAVFFHRTPKNWDSFWPEYRDTYFTGGAPLHPVFALVGGLRVGFLKFSRVSHPQGLTGLTVDISINLAREFRGKGLGTRILSAVLDHLNESGVDSVYAEILSGNLASIKAFAAAGFVSIGADSKSIPDTGETHSIVRFLADLTLRGDSRTERPRCPRPAG